MATDRPRGEGEIGRSAGEALEELLPELYGELRRLAAACMRAERSGHTLQPTALVHEAYLRLAPQRRARWASRRQLLSVAGRVMRRVLVDHARARAAERRGGHSLRVTFSEGLVAAESGIEVLALEQALERLEALDPRLVRIVELRHFAGMSVAETADLLSISPATVKREWSAARAWLIKELSGAGDGG
jgi:RNA polymerase sigma factor (TIGR02999 family)